MWTKALAAVAAMFAGAIASSGAAMAQAESYPDRPIHFVAPYNPGGTVDPTARVLGEAVAFISCAAKMNSGTAKRTKDASSPCRTSSPA
jgi:tripartite-type tricarboxylate transporter receptor subunit TctC